MATILKMALTAICLCTLVATAFLTMSLLALRPPGASYQQWPMTASVIVAQGVLTLVALWTESPRALRYVAGAGGLAIAALGADAAYRTLSGPDFEGYALVLGSVMAIQGMFTVIAFAEWPALHWRPN